MLNPKMQSAYDEGVRSLQHQIKVAQEIRLDMRRRRQERAFLQLTILFVLLGVPLILLLMGSR